MISINAAKGDLKPKNKIDHNEFKINCPPKIIKAVLFFLSQTRYKEIPINRYNVIQTGPKIQFGGLKLGLFKVINQVETEDEVKKEPIIPAN